MKFHYRRLWVSCALAGVGNLYEQTLGSEKCAVRLHERMEAKALSNAVARTEKAVLLVFNEIVIKVEKGAL